MAVFPSLYQAGNVQASGDPTWINSFLNYIYFHWQDLHVKTISEIKLQRETKESYSFLNNYYHTSRRAAPTFYHGITVPTDMMNKKT